jgi:hypothetical protein
MIDEPYALILEKLLKWDVEHCTNCSMPVLAGIPCNDCTFVSILLYYWRHECFAY